MHNLITKLISLLGSCEYTTYKRMVRFVLACAVLFTAPPLLAAGYYQGVVTNVFVIGNNAHIKLSQGNGVSTCGNGDAFYFDVATESGKAMLSLSITAKVTGNLVWVAGTSSCRTGHPYNGSEVMYQIDLKG